MPSIIKLGQPHLLYLAKYRLKMLIIASLLILRTNRVDSKIIQPLLEEDVLCPTVSVLAGLVLRDYLPTRADNLYAIKTKPQTMTIWTC